MKGGLVYGKYGWFEKGTVVPEAGERWGRRGRAGCRHAMVTSLSCLTSTKTPEESPALQTGN